MSDRASEFAQGYTNHVDEIYRYVFYAVGQHSQLAEDLTATIFMKALEKYNPRKAALRTFLYRVARTTVIDHYRKHTSDALPDDAAGSTPAVAPSQQSAEAALIWQRARGALTPEAYEILVLQYRNDLPLVEIAALTGKTVEAVKASLKRSKATLRQLYDHEPTT